MLVFSSLATVFLLGSQVTAVPLAVSHSISARVSTPVTLNQADSIIAFNATALLKSRKDIYAQYTGQFVDDSKYVGLASKDKSGSVAHGTIKQFSSDASALLQTMTSKFSVSAALPSFHNTNLHAKDTVSNDIQDLFLLETLALGGILDILSHQITNPDLLSTLKTISTTLGQAESTINTYKNGPSAPTNLPHPVISVDRVMAGFALAHISVTGFPTSLAGVFTFDTIPGEGVTPGTEVTLTVHSNPGNVVPSAVVFLNSKGAVSASVEQINMDPEDDTDGMTHFLFTTPTGLGTNELNIAVLTGGPGKGDLGESLIVVNSS